MDEPPSRVVAAAVFLAAALVTAGWLLALVTLTVTLANLLPEGTK